MRNHQWQWIRTISAVGLLVGLASASPMTVQAEPVNLAPLLESDVQAQWKALEQNLAERQILKPQMAQAYHPAATILDTDRDPLDITLRRVAALLENLKPQLPVKEAAAWQERLSKLQERALAEPVPVAPPAPAVVPPTQGTDSKKSPPPPPPTPPVSEARQAIYRELCALRREIAFANPLVKIDRLLAVRRFVGPGHMCDQFFGYRQHSGGSLVVLNHPFSAAPELTDPLAGVKVANGRLMGKEITGRGSFLSPSLSYDGKNLYFAWCEGAGPLDEDARKIWNKVEISLADQDTNYNPDQDCKAKFSPENTFHVFKVNVDGNNLLQLTDGTWNDFDPAELPDGRLVLISERRGGFGRCHGRYCPVYTLHTMNADGSKIEALSYHESNEWHPSVNHDGMLIYSRWDYWDRGFNQAHHPWITTPDGYDPRALQGNYPAASVARPNMELNVRAIPDSRCYIGTAAAHHAQAFGSLVVLDPQVHDDQAMLPLRRFTPEVAFPEVPEAGKVGHRHQYATAWPLSEKYCLAAYTPADDKWNHGIYLVDAFGNKELIYRDEKFTCVSPMPIRPEKKPPVVPTTVDEKNVYPAQTITASGRPIEMGPVRIINVYNSDKPLPTGVKISAIRVMQIVQKSFPIHNQPRIGYGADKGARAVLGTVPVEADGSAHFLAPVNVPIFFQLLDDQGQAIQGMRSNTWVMRGQQLTCLGCHEERQHAPQPTNRLAVALQKPPVNIRPEVEGSNPLSYPRLVQPVLDRNCVECHRKNAEKAPDLAAGEWEKHPFKWFTSYANLQKYAFFYGSAVSYPVKSNQYDGWTSSRSEPGQIGALGSKLYPLLVKGHHDLKLSPEDLHRISLWLDCNSDFFGAYENWIGQSRGEIVHAKLE